jgi:hypothetical protein
MSNIASTAMQKTATSPKAGPMGPQERAFNTGTLNLLDEARNVVENAVQQGQELNPEIYRMLGMDPQYEDHSKELADSQAQFDAASKQMEEAQTTMSQLKGIPRGKRTPQQQKQFQQLKKQIPAFQRSLETARNAHGRLATMPKTITGFNRLDAENIPSQSPFSAENPLYKIQRVEAENAQNMLTGGMPVDPTLLHSFDTAESKLRAQLASRYGPDYENSSVGQMALQNFARNKNESIATWRNNMAQQYATAAFSQAGSQQSLLQNLIGMYREPGTMSANLGTQLENIGIGRQGEESQMLAEREAERGMQQSTVSGVPVAALAAQGLAGLMTTPYTSGGQQTTLGGQAIRAGAQGLSTAYNALTSGGAGAAGTGAAYNAGAAGAAATGGEVAGAEGGMSAAGVGEGMSALL